jgi:hypothetical protein
MDKRNMEDKLSALVAYRKGKLNLPHGYRIECDAELLTLHRHDGSKIAAFTAHVPPAEVAKAARGDYYLSNSNQQRESP